MISALIGAIGSALALFVFSSSISLLQTVAGKPCNCPWYSFLSVLFCNKRCRHSQATILGRAHVVYRDLFPGSEKARQARPARTQPSQGWSRPQIVVEIKLKGRL